MADESYRYEHAGRFRTVSLMESLTYTPGDLWRPHWRGPYNFDYGTKYVLPQALKTKKFQSVEAALAHLRRYYH